MASNSTLDDLAGVFARGMAAFAGYPVAAPQSDGDDGWLLTGHATEPDLRIFTRERHKALNDSPPAIVLVGLGGDIVAPGEQGTVGMPGSNRDANTTEGVNLPVRQIRVRKLKVEVTCWGKNQEQAETLLCNAVNVFESSLHNALSFSQEVWVNQQPGQDSNAAHGDMISFIATVNVSVMTAPGSIKIVTAVNNALSLQTPAEVVNVNLS